MATETKTEGKKTDELRTRLARVVLGACTLVAALIVLGAVLVAVRGSINADNDLVRLLLDIAETFDGPFSRKDGIFDFDGTYGVTLDAVVNWGIAAVVWLGVGRIVSGVIRP
ncbi:MAG: hypothetical protein LH468_10270 [Nocardioides sp.]|nr:hypothetical protein [Nocardioides sp.]